MIVEHHQTAQTHAMNQQAALENVIEQIRRCGFWFVDIPRTSSSSIRAELGKIYGSPYGKMNLIEKEHSSEQVFQDHIPAKIMKELFQPGIWEELFTFALVRNPWDRMVSLYNHRRRVQGIPEEVSFRDYILELGEHKWGIAGGLFAYHAHYLGCSDYVCGVDGKILVKFVGKFENRSRDIARIAEAIGTQGLGALAIQKASPPDRHYSLYYDEDTRNIVGELYARDIELFDYKFQETS